MIKSIVYVVLTLFVAKNIAGRHINFKPRTFSYTAKYIDDARVEAAAVVGDPGEESSQPEPARRFRKRRGRNRRRGNLGKKYIDSVKMIV